MIQDLKSIKREKKNLRRLNAHSISAGHKAVIQELVKSEIKRLEWEFIDAQRKTDLENFALKATSRMFRTVFAEVRANIPLQSHHLIVDLQKINGIRLGTHFFNKYGAKRIIENISLKMKQTLIQELKSKLFPFSFILDTSDAGYHYLSVLIQSIERERPVVYFYKLIKLGTDETGKGLFEALTKELIDDDLLDHTKLNLVGVATDGAMSFRGHKNGLVGHLKRLLSKNIFTIHCLAHR